MQKVPVVRPVWLIALACAVAGAVLFVAVKKTRPSGRGEAGAVPPKKGGAAVQPANVKPSGREGQPKAAGAGAREVTVKGTNATDAAADKVARTPDEREAAVMRDLLDTGDEKGAIRKARELLGSDDADVRSKVVTTLGWIGVRALPELTQMLADEDETIAADALTQWKMAYDELADDLSKGELIVSAIGTMKKDTDMESLVMSLSQLQEDVAIRSLVQIIQGSNTVAAEVAREHYSFMTESTYTSPEAAEMYLRARADPVNPVTQ